MSNFSVFSKAVHQLFTQLSAGELYVVDVNGDDLFQAYLAAFPEGTNPVYIERTEHDCSCCKNFIRNIGNVVSISNGKLITVWADNTLPYPYDVVAAKLNELVSKANIVSVFRSSERQYGAEETSQLLEGGTVKKWNHFHAQVASRHFTNQVGQVKGDVNTTAQLFERGLQELTIDAFDQILELVYANNIYRGEEHKSALEGFRTLKRAYYAATEDERKLFVWMQVANGLARFRNTVIGKLVQDVSEGIDLDVAVRSFEKNVAPENYKRPTALITQRMKDDAIKTIDELNLRSALDRRFANIKDVSVNNVLWVDNSVKGLMKDGLDSLLSEAIAPKALAESKAEDIDIADFLANVMPKATSMSMQAKNNHLNNFVSLTAPVHADAAPLFKWSNPFAWSYDGNITDSIKERVKRAGGKIDAKLRVSLSWFNFDDLDIHVFEPNGTQICFYNKCGKLDVDMNAGGGRTREAVENVAWKAPQDGLYRVVVNQCSKRENKDLGFVIEIESDGKLTHLSYDKAVSGNVSVCIFEVRGGVITQLDPASGIVSGSASQTKWGVTTEQPTKVQTLLLSPNYWDDNASGNKHYIFVLEGCKNDAPARGIYNEFLRNDLDTHRKVFEILGEKTKCPVVDDQLSGLGFSSTRDDIVTVLVNNQKQYNIKF